MKHDIPYLTEIRDEIERVKRFTQSGEQEFLKNEMVQYAVARSIQIIGEAAKKLSNDLKGSNPDIPWKRIAGMRDIVVHDYAAIRLDLVWLTVKDDFPILEARVRKLLESTS